MADKDLKIKVSAETTAAEKQIKESFRSQTEASKRQLAIQTADYKAMLRAHESALKDNARFDINLQKQVDREKLQSHKEWLKQIKFNSAVVNKQIADEQKALMKSGKGKGMSGFQMLEFGENLTVVSAGITAAVGGLGAFTLKAINLGAELQVLRSNFIGTAKDLELFKQATAGTVSDKSLIQLSNYASDLGVTLEDQALLFSLAEDAADKYGGSVEENFQKVINASDGTAKGLRAVGISTKEFEQELNKLVTATGKHLDSLSAEEQQNLRIQTILNLTGVTIEGVTKKTQDNKDKIDSLKVSAENLTAAFGEGVVVGLNSTISKMGVLEGTLDKLGIKLLSFSELAKITGMVLSKPIAVTMFDGFYSATEKAIDKLKEFLNLRPGALEGTQTYQFEYSTDSTIQYDRYGNPIAPKPVLAENTMYKAGKNLGDGKGDTSRGGSNADKIIDSKLEAAKVFVSPGGTIAIRDTSGVEIAKKLIGGLSSEDVKQIGWQVESDTIAGIKGKDSFGETASKTLEDTQTIYGTVSQTMSLIGITTDSFLGKLVGGFGTVLTIMESIKAVNTIFSFIPGLATGGLTSGVNWVGEQGKELLFSPGSYVMNHSDSMRFVNQNSSGSNVNVYLAGNIDVTAALKKENKKYRYITVKQ